MKDRVSIFVAILTTNSTVHMDIATLMSTMHQSNARSDNTKYSTGIFNGINGYANARNSVADYFLKRTLCDWLWFIDDDIVPPPDVMKLTTVEGADIIAPLMPTIKTLVTPATNGGKRKLQSSIPICASRYTNLDDLDSMTYIDMENENGIVEVDAVGMGCTLISRGVLKHPGMTLDGSYIRPDGVAMESDPDEPAAIFRYSVKPNGRLISGEDYDFCRRARQLGFEIKLNMDIFCGHQKVVDIGKVFAMKEYVHFAKDDKEALLEAREA